MPSLIDDIETHWQPPTARWPNLCNHPLDSYMGTVRLEDGDLVDVYVEFADDGTVKSSCCRYGYENFQYRSNVHLSIRYARHKAMLDADEMLIHLACNREEF